VSFRRKALQKLNSPLNRLGMRLLSLHEYNSMLATYEGPTINPPEIPAEARRFLDWNNPTLKDLHQRYVGHPASSHSQWSEKALRQSTDLQNFRGDNHYVYQTRWSPSAETYALTAFYARDIDRLNLFGQLREDGLFGAYTQEFEGGYVVSRDLLDSINQTNVIARLLGCNREDRLDVLDVGAGYGRLAHRVTEGLPQSHVTCTDAVPLSTFISEFYLKFRGVKSAEVIALDQVEARLPNMRFDIATNFHSFSECTQQAIKWWLDLLARVDVRKLLIIPNRADAFLSTETNGDHIDFLPLILKSGWKQVYNEPIYAASTVAQALALYPNFRFFLFERE